MSIFILKKLEVPPGFEPGNEGFADLCLTAWLWYRIWSGRRGSNPRPLPWQGNALPTEPLPHILKFNYLLIALARQRVRFAPTSLHRLSSLSRKQGNALPTEPLPHI